MSNNTNSNTSGGIGFIGLLTIAFIVLKLTGYITWSWFWVLSPMIFAFVLVVVFATIVAFLSMSADNKRKW